MKFRTSADGAQQGDIVSTPEGKQGICLNDGGFMCWREPGEPDEWWLHRAQCLNVMLSDIASRSGDGSVHPGGRTKP